MKSLELKVPPVALVLAAGPAMWLAARGLPALRMELPGGAFVAGVFAALGILIAIAGVAEFRRARTTVNPMNPSGASSLVSGGVYRFTRNPMYLGMAFVLAGWGLTLGHPVSLALLFAFVLYMNRFQIIPEERALEAIFGEAFADYCVRVRRWL